ncbi:hypothetical protein HOK00_05125 [bacterium]|nr:hypothetical protein [bacterium]
MNEDDLCEYLKSSFKSDCTKVSGSVFFGLSGAYSPWQIFHIIVLTRAMEKMGNNIDYFVGNNQKEMEKVISFNSRTIFKINKFKVFLKYFFKIIFYNVAFLRSYGNFEKIFDLHVQGVYIGDYIYDEFLRLNNQSSINKINFKYIVAINKALVFYFYYTDIFKNNQYKYVFTSHAWYIRFGLLARVARKNNIKVLNYISGADSGTGIILSKLYPKENFHRYASWVDKKTVERYKDDKIVMKKASRYFSDIVNNLSQHSDSMNYLSSKIFSNDGSLLKLKEIIKNKNKKVVVIVAHVLIDNVTGLNGRDQIYRDYFIWLRETLKLCEKNRNIITLLKLHPMEDGYNYSPKTLEIYKKMHLKNVLLWPNDVDFRGSHDLVDLVITVNGSVSVEFPCFGVPVICASSSSAVTGLQTIIEPKNEKEYRRVIAHAHKIIKLDLDIINQAKLLYFLYYKNLWYDLDNNFYPTALDTIKEEFLPFDFHISPTPVLENYINIIIDKLNVFNEEYEKKYLSDITCFFNNNNTRNLSDLDLQSRLEKY